MRWKTIINKQFQKIFNAKPELIVRSPARINLIGEHTDYNGGFVLPAAINRAIFFAISPRKDDICTVFSYDFQEKATFSIQNLTKNDATWTYYIKGVIDQFLKEGHAIQGFNLVFGGDIPTGAGLSSSAALEGGLAFSLNILYNLNLPTTHLATLCQRAENEFVGLQCGIMDMFASLLGKKNSVLLLDCRSLEYEYMPFSHPKYVFILCDTGVKHVFIGESEYNVRRRACESGVAILQKYYPHIQLLRDVTKAMLEAHQQDFDAITYQRCWFVIEEIERVKGTCEDLKNKNLVAFGQKMYATHEGLQHEYEVSCPELDFLVEQTRANPHVLGARMMGGGFGGCTINLVKADKATAFVEELRGAYQQFFGREMLYYVVKPSNGTEVVTHRLPILNLTSF
jgi:galactokinase